MVRAVRAAPGVLLEATSLPKGPTRRLWYHGGRWLDETPMRRCGFDGTHHWVQYRGSRTVYTWKLSCPQNTKTLLSPEEGAPNPLLLTLLRDERQQAPEELAQTREGDTWIWTATDTRFLDPIFHLNAARHTLKLASATYLPLRENGAAAMIGPMAHATASAPSFFTFPVSGIPAPYSVGSPTEDTELPPTLTEYTAQATYRHFPEGGFGPPARAPVSDLDSLATRWETRLRRRSLAVLASERFKATIHHASRDAQGNVYLVYSGDPLTPVVPRTRYKMALTFPDYDTLPLSGIGHATLPATIESRPLHLLALTPLRNSRIGATTLSLYWTEQRYRGGVHTTRLSLPLEKSERGPTYLLFRNGPPTLQHRQAAVRHTLENAVRRAHGRQITPQTADSLGKIVEDVWPGSSPWEVLLLRAEAEVAAKRLDRAYEFARQAQRNWKPSPGNLKPPSAIHKLLAQLEK
jgi:hypothetical protein